MQTFLADFTMGETSFELRLSELIAQHYIAMDYFLVK